MNALISPTSTDVDQEDALDKMLATTNFAKNTSIELTREYYFNLTSIFEKVLKPFDSTDVVQIVTPCVAKALTSQGARVLLTVISNY